MAATSLPTLPGCGRAASARIDIYSLGDGQHGDAVAGVVYACDQHAPEMLATLRGAGLNAYRTPTAAGVKRCGDGFDFLSGLPLTAPTPPESDDWHPDWCERPHRYGDGYGHASPALQVVTDSGLTEVRLEQQRPEGAPLLTVSHWHTRNDPTDEPLTPAEPHEMVWLPVPAAAELAAHIAALVAADLGGAR